MRICNGGQKVQLRKRVQMDGMINNLYTTFRKDYPSAFQGYVIYCRRSRKLEKCCGVPGGIQFGVPFGTMHWSGHCFWRRLKIWVWEDQHAAKRFAKSLWSSASSQLHSTSASRTLLWLPSIDQCRCKHLIKGICPAALYGSWGIYLADVGGIRD